MKRKFLMAIASLLCASSAMAQEISPYQAYQIKNQVDVKILEIKRVEKYGWDNLEIKYELINESDYDLQKLDFFVHLLDENGEEIGSIELFAFDISKSSKEKLKSIEVLSPYVNEDIATQIVETKLIEVFTDENKESIVSIQASDLRQK